MKKSSKISDEDKKRFRDAVGNVKPIKNDNIISEKPKPSAYRKKDKTNYLNPDYEINESVATEKLVGGEEEIKFCSAGENDKKFKRLRQGKYKFEGKLDLHGMLVEEAKQQLAIFLKECKIRSLACVLIIHGKGYGSKNNAPVIKNKLNQWLRNHSMVWGFCSARPSDGGTGAIYVYLKSN